MSPTPYLPVNSTRRLAAKSVMALAASAVSPICRIASVSACSCDDRSLRHESRNSARIFAKPRVGPFASSRATRPGLRELVAAGHARVHTYPGDSMTINRLLLRAQDQARNKQVGIWAPGAAKPIIEDE